MKPPRWSRILCAAFALYFCLTLHDGALSAQESGRTLVPPDKFSDGANSRKLSLQARGAIRSQIVLKEIGVVVQEEPPSRARSGFPDKIAFLAQPWKYEYTIRLGGAALPKVSGNFRFVVNDHQIEGYADFGLVLRGTSIGDDASNIQWTINFGAVPYKPDQEESNARSIRECGRTTRYGRWIPTSLSISSDKRTISFQNPVLEPSYKGETLEYCREDSVPWLLTRADTLASQSDDVISNQSSESSTILGSNKQIANQIASLRLLPHPPGSGIYAIEQEIIFNVLDRVVFQPDSGQLSLIGHYDPRYAGPRIHYLQHLATLLDNPGPEFSFEWTPDSETRFNEQLRLMDSIDEDRRIGAELATNLLDSNGHLTSKGQWFLTAIGITPAAGVSFEDLTPVEIIGLILLATDNPRGAEIARCFGTMAQMAKDKTKPTNDAILSVISELIEATNLEELNRDLREQAKQGVIDSTVAWTRLWRGIFGSTEQILGLRRSSLTSAFDRALPTNPTNQDVQTAIDVAKVELDRQMTEILEADTKKLLDRKEEVRVPAAVMESVLGIHPEMVPKFYDIDPHSLLAQVMFDADYLGKSLTEMSELKTSVPRYQTEFGFRLSHQNGSRPADSISAERLWISIDALDMAQSSDGYTLETRGAKMRFNIRGLGSTGRDRPAVSNGYEALLTSLYDDFAVRFHVLHELQECAKLVAVSAWLRELRPQFRLPQKGRMRWDPPSLVSGLAFLVWSPHSRPGIPDVQLSGEGGVSLAMPSSPRPFHTDRAIVPSDSLASTATQNRGLRIKDVPFPRPPGWATVTYPMATKGWEKEALIRQAISVLKDSETCDAARMISLSKKLDFALSVDKELQRIDHAINTINSKDADRQAEFARLEAQATLYLKEATAVRNASALLVASGLMTEAAPDLIPEIAELQKTYRVDLPQVLTTMNEEIRDLMSPTQEDAESVESKSREKQNLAREVYKDILGVVAAPGTPGSSQLKKTAEFGKLTIEMAELAQREWTVIALSAKEQKLTDQTRQALDKLTYELVPVKNSVSNQLDQLLKDPEVRDWIAGKKSTCQ